jgi:hypothetical protein
MASLSKDCIMSKEPTSKVARHGRRALVTLGLGRRSTGGPYVAIAGFALVAGAVFVLSLARKALTGLAPRAKSPSTGKDRPLARSSGAPEDAAHGAMERSQANDLERAENEGMYPSRW